MGMRLNRDLILKADDIHAEEVRVPEWADPETGADTVLVRGLTGRERDEYETAMVERRGKQYVPNPVNVRARLVVRCVVGEDGQRLFADGDADELGAKSGAAVNRVYAVAARLSGLSDEDAEELAENFGITRSGFSSSTSPPASGKRPPNSSRRSPAGS